MNTEEQYNEMEAARIDSSEQYFSARPQIDTNDRRKVFEAGFDRGWKAGLRAKSVPVLYAVPDFDEICKERNGCTLCSNEPSDSHTVPLYTTPQPPQADTVLERGISTRDWFAGQVCAALMTTTSADTKLPNLDYKGLYDNQTKAERIAEISYQMADAMLAPRREK